MKASKMIEWAIVHKGDGYVYGTVGETCTLATLKTCELRYGKIMDVGYFQLNGDHTKGRCAKWIGKWVADCSGFLKAGRKFLDGVWADVSAQGTYEQCKTSCGIISTMVKIPGTYVFMYGLSSEGIKRMIHVGMYIGGGKVIEARNVELGIVITDLAARAWTHWGKAAYMEFDLPQEKTIPPNVKPTETDSGDGSTVKPDDGKIDTLSELQKAMGLTSDGICGPKTVAALCALYYAKRKLRDEVAALDVRIAQKNQKAKDLLLI